MIDKCLIHTLTKRLCDGQTKELNKYIAKYQLCSYDRGRIINMPFKFRCTVIFLTIFVCLPIYAQKPTPTPERSRQIVLLLDDARVAAPELGVDTFLKVVESK